MGEDGMRLSDGHGRDIRYTRVSLTESCDFRCPFCRPGETDLPAVSATRLRGEEYIRLCAALHDLGVESFKITGGEPFMNPAALDVIRNLKGLPRGARVTVTTNGFALRDHAANLAEAGVDGVNVSLNAVSPEGFARMSGRSVGVGAVLSGIALARECGLAVKLNMVPILGLNDEEIIPILKYASEAKIVVRFIELMPIGAAAAMRGMPFDMVRRRIEADFGPLRAISERFGSGPAAYFRVGDSDMVVGAIAAMSRCFCRACNRVRLTSSGFLRTCLHSDHGIDLLTPLRAGADGETIAGLVRRAVSGKPERHGLTAASTAAPRDVRMFRIGG